MNRKLGKRPGNKRHGETFSLLTIICLSVSVHCIGMAQLLLFRVRAAGLTFSPTPILIRVIIPPVALIWNTEFKIAGSINLVCMLFAELYVCFVKKNTTTTKTNNNNNNKKKPPPTTKTNNNKQQQQQKEEICLPLESSSSSYMPSSWFKISWTRSGS